MDGLKDRHAQVPSASEGVGEMVSSAKASHSSLSRRDRLGGASLVAGLLWATLAAGAVLKSFDLVSSYPLFCIPLATLGGAAAGLACRWRDAEVWRATVASAAAAGVASVATMAALPYAAALAVLEEALAQSASLSTREVAWAVLLAVVLLGLSALAVAAIAMAVRRGIVRPASTRLLHVAPWVAGLALIAAVTSLAALPAFEHSDIPKNLYYLWLFLPLYPTAASSWVLAAQDASF